MSGYSDALEMLHETEKWLRSTRGVFIMNMRADALEQTSYGTLGGDEATRIVLDSLQEAEPIYWDSRLCEVVQGAALSLPIDFRLTSPHLFTRTGYIFFGQPILLPADHEGYAGCNHGEKIVGMSWKQREKSTFIDVVYYVDVAPMSIISVFTMPQWLKAVHMVEPRTQKEIRRRARDILTIPEAEVDRLALQCASDLGVRRRGGIPWTIIPWRLGETIERTLQMSTMEDDSICKICNYAYLQVFGSALNFLNTKVFVSGTRAPDRAVVRRTMPKPSREEIRVVMLRKTERTTHPPDAEPNSVEWAGHWLVGAADGGFWRNQYFPATKMHNYLWIGQYMKGDTSKPFIAPRKRAYVAKR